MKVMKGAQQEEEAPAQLSDIITKVDSYQQRKHVSNATISG